MKRVTIESRNKHTDFGGIIYASDFNTDYHRPNNSVSWADRIANDLAFNRQCKLNAASRDRKKEVEKRA